MTNLYIIYEHLKYIFKKTKFRFLTQFYYLNKRSILGFFRI